jgi:hypothetical protein
MSVWANTPNELVKFQQNDESQTSVLSLSTAVSIFENTPSIVHSDFSSDSVSIQSCLFADLDTNNDLSSLLTTPFIYPSQNGFENTKTIRRDQYKKKQFNAASHSRSRRSTFTWRSKLANVTLLQPIPEEPLPDADVYESHVGIPELTMFSDFIKTLSEFGGISLPDNIIKEAEGLGALFLALKDCQSLSQFTAITFLYVRSHYSDSISSMVCSYIQDVFNAPEIFEEQSGPETPVWLNILREAQESWSLCRNNKVFKQFSKLLSILVTLGLCDAAHLNFSIGGFKLFTDDLTKVHLSCSDMADALFSTITFFAEGMYLSFQAGSIRPLLMNDCAALELDAEYAKITSWWQLVKNGNLARVTGVDDAEFDRRLESLCTSLRNLVGTLQGIDKKIVNEKYMKCLILKNDFVAMKMSSGMRKAPFAIELFGESSQGKTSLGDQLIDALLISANLSIDKKHRASHNPGDKFMSNWTSDKSVILFDDMANEKSLFVEKPPTRAIIDVCNNQMYYAPKAELEAKGKCFVEPDIALVNTNIKNLDAGAYMNCPYATQRRMHMVITVKAKDKYQRFDGVGADKTSCGLDSRKIREEYTIDGVYTSPPIDDIWDLTVERAVKPEELRTIANYATCEFRGQNMKNVSSRLVVQMAIEMFTEHRIDQNCILEAMRQRTNALTKCGHEGCCQMKHYCDLHDHLIPVEPITVETVTEEQFGLETAIFIEKTRRKVIKKCTSDVTDFFAPLETVATTALYALTAKFLSSWDWMTLIPAPALDNEYVRKFALWYWSDTIKRNWWKTTFSMWTLFIIMVFFFPFLFPFAFLTCLYQQIYMVEIQKKRLLDELQSRTNNIMPIVSAKRDMYTKQICGSVVAIGVLYALAKVYKKWANLHNEHGSLEPKTEEDIKQRDSEVSAWTEVAYRPLPITSVSKCVTKDVLNDLVDTNLLYGSIATEKETLMVNVLFISSNLCLLPNHYFERGGDELYATLRKVNAENCGGSFITNLSKTASVQIPGTDLCLCYSSTGGSFRDLIKHFPLEAMPAHPFTMQWRKKTGELVTAHGRAKNAGLVATEACQFPGHDYEHLSIETFKGLCGAVLVSETRGSVISGIHLGGIAGTPQGCSGLLTQSQLYEAQKVLKKVNGVMLSGSIDKFEPHILNVNVLTGKPLHPKSPMNYLPHGSQLNYHGSCTGSVTTYTDVKQTPISPIVEEVCGQANEWGSPKHAPQWWGFQKCLESLSLPAKPFPHELLEVAIADYKEPLLELLKLPIWAKSRPLTTFENVNGIPGVKFMDGIKLSTSIGYPLTGPKRDYITELPPTKEKPSNRVLDQEILDEIDRNEELYRQGYRAFTIAKACKKDEVISQKKDKCRIFYGNSISQTFLIRKYFLPIVRFMQMNPLVSESAVGINSHGPEWEQFYKHVMSNGEERIFGGDYGKYDQKLPSQILFASLRILIDFARECDYSEEDIGIMEAMTGDLVFALIAFNGDLVGLLTGAHISGNSLTVGVNGIGGSLNLRCNFFTVYPKTIKFRDAAAMSTYGDDNVGTVKEEFPLFNIKDCSKFLEAYGQTYTMPDKTSELQSYLPPDEFEFLKRTSVYHPALGQHVGALGDSSIFKSLHNVMRGKQEVNTMETACALNIDGALREWFNHGEVPFEMRREQMTEVAAKSGLSHLCTGLGLSYQDRCTNWRADYL